MITQAREVICAGLVVSLFSAGAMAGQEGIVRRDVASDYIEEMQIPAQPVTETGLRHEAGIQAEEYVVEEEEEEVVSE